MQLHGINSPSLPGLGPVVNNAEWIGADVFRSYFRYEATEYRLR